jgi:UDP-N-acetylglucosamine--N-acetylmuramyl-(pentapeptide) pyrophosphoryl-undecaprenol N-acetylglucosamine transferase
MIMKKKNAPTSSTHGKNSSHDNNNICFVAGKSGGHILPALTLAAQHKKQFPKSSILFFSTSSTLDKQIIGPQSTIDAYIPLELENLPRSKIYQLPRFGLSVLKAFFRAVQELRRLRPTRVISMGGYISVPVCTAAWLLRIPVELYELNATPGRAVKFLAPISTRINICFTAAAQLLPAAKCRVAPYPLRFTNTDKEGATNILGFLPTRKTILIVGGSQGSLFINQAFQQYLQNNPLATQKIQVIHQTGAHDTTDWKSWYHALGIPAIVFAYHPHMQQFYRAADLIICRAGAGTLWEIAFFEKRALCIPLETVTTDHQIDNARAIAQQYPHLFTIITHKEMVNDSALFNNCITSLASL